MSFNKFNTVQWYQEHLKKVEDLYPDYDPSSKSQAYHALAENDGLVTGLLYEEKGVAAFDQITPAGERKLVDHVENRLTNSLKTL